MEEPQKHRSEEDNAQQVNERPEAMIFMMIKLPRSVRTRMQKLGVQSGSLYNHSLRREDLAQRTRYVE